MRTAKDLRDGCMTTRNLIWIAFGRNAAKKIQRGLQCSQAQAWRIVSSGYVPPHFEGPFYDLVVLAIEERQREICAASDIITAYRLGSGLRTVATLAGAQGDRGPSQAAKSDGQSAFSFLKKRR